MGNVSIFSMGKDPNKIEKSSTAPAQYFGAATGGVTSPMLNVNSEKLGQAFGQLPFGGIIRLDKYRKVVEEPWL